MPWRNNLPALLLAGIVAAAAVSAAPRPTATPAESADQFLRDSVTAPRRVSYIGELQTIHWGTAKANATIVRIEHRAPADTRRWYVAPEALYGDYAVTHGNTTYHFDVQHKAVSISHNPLMDSSLAASDNFNLLRANYRSVLGPAETIAGRLTQSISLVNKFTGERAMRVWIDGETKLVLQRENYHGNGAVSYQTRYANIRYTNSIPAAMFDTAVPAGFSTAARRDYGAPSSNVDGVVRSAGFAPASPKYLPDGFNAVSADVTDLQGVRTLHVLYSDGVRAISLFENKSGASPQFGTLKAHPVRFEDHEGQLLEDGPNKLLTWQEHGVHFALVSDLAEREVLEIATSVVP
jgi:negative regulator of sigma E activity